MNYRRILSRAEQYILDNLLEIGQSVVTHYTFFRLIQAMYRDGKGLYLRHETPTAEDDYKYLRNMREANAIRYDSDYQQRLIRVLHIAEVSTEDIICIADSLCYVSHISAMHRWGDYQSISYTPHLYKTGQKNLNFTAVRHDDKPFGFTPSAT